MMAVACYVGSIQFILLRWYFLSCALRDLRPVAAALEYQAGRTKDA